MHLNKSNDYDWLRDRLAKIGQRPDPDKAEAFCERVAIIAENLDENEARLLAFRDYYK